MTKAELCKKLNGLEILWIGEDGLTFKSIVLADPKKGISIKPLMTKKAVARKIIKYWGREKNDPSPYSDKFCLANLPPKNILKAQKMLKKIIITKIHDTTDMSSRNRNPTCVF